MAKGIVYSKKNPLLRWLVDEGCWLVEEELSAFWNDIPFKVGIGFKTDLASIPRALRSLIPQVGKHIQAAIFHDLIYRARYDSILSKKHWGLSRSQADNMLLDGMKYSGVGYMKRYAIYWGVRSGGMFSWED